MRKTLDLAGKAALLLALPFVCGGCRAALQSLNPAPPPATASNAGTPNFPENVPPPGMTPSSVRVPASLALTGNGVRLKKVALPKASAVAVAMLESEMKNAAAWTQRTQKQFFPEVASGAGIIVCEPVIAGASTRAAKNGFDGAAFGAGCSRWIFLQVGGRGELGKTPTWGAIDDARGGRGLKNLQLNAAQASVLASALGVTHTATARFSGSETRGTLTYELWRVKQKTRVGAPLVASGSAAQIVAQLPNLAREMASRLGASTRGIETIVGTDAAGVTFLGSGPWKAFSPLSDSDTTRMRQIAARVPLATLLLVRNGSVEWGDPRDRAVVTRAFQIAPDNALLLADLVYKSAASARPHFSLIDAGLKKYPANALFNFADLIRWRELGDLKKERVAAESLVSCAPRSFMSWLQLGDTISNIAHELRRGRYSSDLNESESKFLERLYRQRLWCALYSARLSPNYGSWSEVSEGATFCGLEELADLALWKSIALERRASSTYDWGFQIYRKKWYANPERVKLLTKMVYSDENLTRHCWSDAVDALSSVDLDTEAQRQLLHTVGLLEDEIKRDPNDARAHWTWARLARDKGHNGSKDSIALREFRATITLLPNAPVPMVQLGEMLHYKKRQYREAEKLYRAALKLHPDYAAALKSLGNLTYYVHRNVPEAEKLYRRAIALSPDSGLYHAELARLLLDQGKKTEALKEARAAIAEDYTDEKNEIFARLQLDPIDEWRKIVGERDQKLFQF